MKGDSASTMKNYDALKTRMASVDPSSTSMDAYKPTNSPAACPEVGKNWKVKGEALPPKPDPSLCECMYNSLSCVPADGLKVSEYGSVFGYICGEAPEACEGISGNATSGVYGAFSMCNATQQLGFVLDAYYALQDRASDACDFDGKAVAREASGTDEKCRESLARISSAGNIAPTSATDDGDAEESSNAAAPVPMRSLFTMGDAAVGLYVVVAMAVGASMVLL